MKPIRHYSHIIWDWNGTLLDDAGLCIEVMNASLGRRGMPLLTPARYKSLFTFPVERYYRQLGFDFAKESFAVLGTEFIDAYEQRRGECTLHTHAQQTLAAIAEAGVGQSIVSAYQQRTLLDIVSSFGLNRYFSAVVGLDDHYAHSKAHLAESTIKRLDVPESDILFIGDTVHDAEIANLVGADCVLIPGGHQSRQRLEATAVPVYGSLEELLTVFRSETTHDG